MQLLHAAVRPHSLAAGCAMLYTLTASFRALEEHTCIGWGWEGWEGWVGVGGVGGVGGGGGRGGRGRRGR